MRKGHVLALSALLCMVAVAVSPAVVADSEITVAVDGEQVADGGTVEVDTTPEIRVMVESDTTLSSVSVSSGSSFAVTQLNRRSYNVTHTVTVLNEQDFTVRVMDVEGNTYTHVVTLTRPSETAMDVQRDVRSLENEVESFRDDVERLEERRDELRRRNENLTQQLNETRAALNETEDEDSDGDGEGMPGFTAAVALVAVTAFAVVVARKRR